MHLSPTQTISAIALSIALLIPSTNAKAEVSTSLTESQKEFLTSRPEWADMELDPSLDDVVYYNRLDIDGFSYVGIRYGNLLYRADSDMQGQTLMKAGSGFLGIEQGMGAYARPDGIATGVGSYAGERATSYGTQGYAADNATQVGFFGYAGNDATAIGQGAYASGPMSTAIGNFSSATAFGCVAIGNGSSCREEDVLSIGDDRLKRRLINLNRGINPSDAVNVEQLNEIATLFGGGAAVHQYGFTPPTYDFMSGATYYNVADAAYDLDRRVWTLEQNPSTGGGTTPGPQGPQGEPGDSITGEKGDKGEKGDPGRDGSATISAGKNITTETDSEGTTTVSLSDNVELSAQGRLAIQGGASISGSGVDAGNQRVTSVSDGRIEQGSMDAINGGQAWAMEQRFNDQWTGTNNRIDDLERRFDDKLNALGAKAAAMSQVNVGGSPLEVGEGELGIAGGASSNKTAVAVGAKFRVSERWSVSGAFAVGGGSSAMGSIGAHYKFGR